MKKIQLTILENAFLKYATGILILVIPLYPKFPFLSVPGTYVAIRLEDFLVAVILTGWMGIVIRRRIKIWQDPIIKAVLVYLFAVFLAALSGILVLKTTSPLIAILHAGRRVEYMAVMFVAAMAVLNRDNLKFYIKLLFIALIVTTIYGLGQKFFALPVISTMNNEFSRGLALNLGPEARINSTFAGHYDLSAYLVSALLVVLGTIIYVKKFSEKVSLFILFSLFVWLMVGSASRVSLVAYLSVAVLLLLLTKKVYLLICVLTVSLLMAAFSQSLTSRYAGLTNVLVKSVYSRYLALTNSSLSNPNSTPIIAQQPMPTPISVAGGLGTIGKGTPKPSPKPHKVRPTPVPELPAPVEDRSTSIRVIVEWPRAIRAFEKNPLLGTGPSSITLATDNDYLRSLGESGAVGFLAFSLVFVQIWLVVKKLFNRPLTSFEGIFGRAMFFGVLGLLLNAVFIDVFEASKVALTFWVLTGIWIGTARLPEINSQK